MNHVTTYILFNCVNSRTLLHKIDKTPPRVVGLSLGSSAYPLNPGTQFNYMEGFSSATAGRLDMDSVKLTAPVGAANLRIFVQDIATAQWRELNFGDELKTPYFANKAALGKYRFYIQAVQPGKSVLQVLTRIGGQDVTSRKLTVASATLITPAGDPVNTPVDGGDGSGTVPDGANEFTFSTASVGVLTIKFKAKMIGASTYDAATQAQLRFDMDRIGDSVMEWDAANPDGRPTVSGDYLTATVRFKGLPTRNEHFGKKKTRLKLGAEKLQESELEVFFPRDATNHPGLNAGVDPNWFYYWKQVSDCLSVSRNLIYGGASVGYTAAEVRAMVEWDYNIFKNKNEITIYSLTCNAGRSYGVGTYFSGIDFFIATVYHENKHVVQISLADLLVATGRVNTPWKYGWSFNQGARHNHWTLGADSQPGIAGIDDDGDSVIDNLIESGPGELGRGDDIDLTHPTTTSRNWPSAWAIPTPLPYPSEIESEAINEEGAKHNEHKNARDDWGNPGKITKL